MLPGLLQNAYNLHEYATWVLKQNGGTFEFKGPWFTNMNFMVTSDPMNIHHMLSKNFSNYIKGQKFHENFDVLGDGIFNSEQEELSQSRAPKTEEEKFDLLTAIGEQVEEIGGIKKSDKFLRDTAFNLMAAGRDSVSAGLTWLFWIVATHPYVEAKIPGEIKEHLLDKGKLKDFNIDELSKLVYLHGAICESLRLCPPEPFEHKCSVQFDILPSGHSIRPNTTMIYSLYSMGRMESIWGQDCLDFKPERWISEREGIMHVPSFKFITFNAGPRTCLGKDITFIQMKIIASAILWNYSVQVVEGHLVSPSISVILHMKHGLKVRIRKRFCKFKKGIKHL
nr:alkane hydroxylase mah1 [Quercus suber]